MTAIENIVNIITELVYKNSDKGLYVDLLVFTERLLEAYNPNELLEYDDMKALILDELAKFYE